jgi:hypothetical protein
MRRPVPARCAPDPDRSLTRRSSLAGRTSLRSPPEFGVARFTGGQERAFDQDDLVARFPRAGDRQSGSRRTPAARLWPEASRRPADGLAGSVAHARTPGTRAGVTNASQTATLETEICGQRLSTLRAANEPQRRWNRLSRSTTDAASRGNVVLFCAVGNPAGWQDFLVVDAVPPNWSPRSNSLFIREIARYSLILEQLEDRRAAKNVTKRRLWNWTPQNGAGNLLIRFREVYAGEQGILEQSRLGRRANRRAPASSEILEG